MSRALVTWALLLFAPAAGAQSARPTLVPFFHSVPGGGPAFYVECLNDTGVPISSGDRRWALSAASIRVDGKPLPERGVIGPGLTTEIAPGEMWRGIVVLRQSGVGYFSGVRFAAHTRTAMVVPLSEGRHTVSVRCGEEWSDEVLFFWEAERKIELPIPK